MNGSERRAAASLALIYALRMLGLFMILPVFALYAGEYRDTTPLLVGVAIGAYGLTQAAFQIPFGMASDRFGRKRMILIGLLLFALGSVTAALAQSIYLVIAGRALQGCGAIAAVVLALGADLTREQTRTRLMAVIGVSIGGSFAAAFVLGPVIAGWGGAALVFWTNAALALLGVAVLYLLVPTPVASGVQWRRHGALRRLRQVLAQPQLQRLDLGVFVLHLLVTANFVAVPLLLLEAGLAPGAHWKLYLTVLGLSIAIMVPLIAVSERRRRTKEVFLLAIGGLVCAEALLAAAPGASLWYVAGALVLFFGMFNVLEASMPSLVSRLAPAAERGSAMGVFSTSQFLGAFAGGVLGGWLHQHWGFGVVFATLAALGLAWLLLATTMQRPRYLSSYELRIGPRDLQSAGAMATRLRQIRGVAEAVVVAEDGVAYLKVDRSQLDESALRRCC